jgi:hypothetical protein
MLTRAKAGPVILKYLSPRRRRKLPLNKILCAARSEISKEIFSAPAGSGPQDTKDFNMLRLAILLIALVPATLAADEENVPRPGNPRGYETDILIDTFGFGQADIDAPIDKVFQGCSERDCIPSIDAPAFVPADAVDFLEPDDLVLSLELEGEKRAYAARILDVHEIVNDRFGQTPVLVSYCPLCGSGLAFRRELDGETVEFGVSGLLHNNDLIMYDRKSESLWQQITGQAIAGPKRGAVLEAIPLTMVVWEDWRSENPQGKVLALPGHRADYVQEHYAQYAQSDRLLFPVTAQSARLGPKRIIYGIETGGSAVAVDAEWLRGEGSWSHALSEGELRVEMHSDGGVKGSLGGEPVPVHRMYWFAWYSFHPNTSLIDGRE